MHWVVHKAKVATDFTVAIKVGELAFDNFADQPGRAECSHYVLLMVLHTYLLTLGSCADISLFKKCSTILNPQN